MKRLRYIAVIKVSKGTPVPDHVPDEAIRESKSNYHYDWISKTTVEDEDTEEETTVEKYISREDTINDVIKFNSNLYYMEKSRDTWIIDAYTRKVVAVLSVDVTVTRL